MKRIDKMMVKVLGETVLTSLKHTPLLGERNNEDEAQESDENVASPLPPLFSPITPISPSTFLSGGNIVIPESRQNSSPVRTISPSTLEWFEAENNFINFCDGDSVKDPDYIDDTDLSLSSECTVLEAVNNVTPRRVRSVKNLSNSHNFMTDSGLQTQQQTASVTHSITKSCRQFEEFIPKSLKRRRSENDLKQNTPLKKAKRSISIPGLHLADPPQTLKLPSPKKRPVSDPSKWKRFTERKKRLRGEAYKTIKGKSVAATPFKKPACLNKPKHKCSENVPEDVRNKIYESFRSLNTLEEQRQFIVQHVLREKKKRSTKDGASRKECTNKYSFTVSATEKVPVCREFFLDTLNIKEGVVRGALKKVSFEGVLLADRRGKKAPPNKLTPYRYNLVKNHIFSFPVMESHYCRKKTEYRYLDSGLNLRIMYDEYKKMCKEKNTPPTCIEKYRKVFRSYKLRFHVPKKDLCKKCIAHKESKPEEMTISQRDSYAKHLKRRDDAYLRRDADKEAANTDDKTLAFNFDLEAVLHTPKGASGPFFYVRKLAVYNLTMYQFGSRNVDCYTWDETEGKRGSTEIATCVYKYISRNQEVSHVRMMSDNCGGQQKNFNFSSMLLYLVTTHPTIQTIDHVFYESGHSHMECDSVHSKIEQKCKNTAVYTPDGWIQVMRLARSNPRPFNVNVVTHDEFLEFNSNHCQFAAVKKQNKNKRNTKGKNRNDTLETDDETGTPDKIKSINFQDAVWVQYRKKSPYSIYVKSDYNEENFTEFEMKVKKGKTETLMPQTVYNTRIPISKVKKRDLLKLCADNQIPRYYHSFYEQLPDSENVEDRLAEPDVEEDDGDF